MVVLIDRSDKVVRHMFFFEEKISRYQQHTWQYDVKCILLQYIDI